MGTRPANRFWRVGPNGLLRAAPSDTTNEEAAIVEEEPVSSGRSSPKKTQGHRSGHGRRRAAAMPHLPAKSYRKINLEPCRPRLIGVKAFRKT
jgi:hypothetical protein